MRFISKVLKDSLHEKFPDATEDELLKVWIPTGEDQSGELHLHVLLVELLLLPNAPANTASLLSLLPRLLLTFLSFHAAAASVRIRFPPPLST